MTFNHEVVADSLVDHLAFSTARDGRIPIRLVEEPEAETPPPAPRYRIEPLVALPLGEQVRLVVRPGVRSARGPEAGVEERTVLELHTYPRHAFLGVECTDLEDERVHIRPGGPPQAEGRACDPLKGARLLFSTPVARDVLRDHLRVDPDLAGGRDDYDPWERIHDGRWLDRPHHGRPFAVTLPEVLEARSRYRLEGSAEALRDVFDRPLEEDVALDFLTGDRPPNLVLTHPVAVLERDVDTHLPAVVTNLDGLDVRLDRLTAGGHESERLDVPVVPALNVAYRTPLELRRWLGDHRSGAAVATVETRPATPDPPEWFFAQVTPFQVHAKLGHRSSLVWVTDLATGRPVSGARVRLYSGGLFELEPDPRPLSEGITDGDGRATLDGTDRVDPDLTMRRWMGTPEHPQEPLLMVRVDRGDDLALLPLVGRFEARSTGTGETWIPRSLRERHHHIRTWGATAQGVYRLGETVRYKIYVRDQDDRRLVPAPADYWTLEVVDPLGKVVARFEDLLLDDFGALDGEVKIPARGAVGRYQFRLTASFADDVDWTPLTVMVADFTPAPFRVLSELSADLVRPGDELAITTRAELHAGGPYTDAQTRVTVTLTPRPVPAAPALAGFRFDVGGSSAQLHQSTGELDGGGTQETRFTVPLPEIVHGRLQVESAVRDDRGKYVAGRSGTRYVGRDRYVGIHQPDWLLTAGEAATVEGVVVDATGAPVEGTEIETRVSYRETVASRVKGAGNAYLTRYEHRWVEVASCRTPSRSEPVACSFVPEEAGLYRIEHRITDTAGRRHASTLQRWARGRGSVVWETPPGHQLPIVPERTEYRVGETARFLIQNPFPGARALLTVERYGIQRSWTRVLETATEVVEVEVTPEHLPGFYLSVVVTSPRVEAPPGARDERSESGESGEGGQGSQGGQAGEGEVDLGKPAFRMGYARIEVRDPYKEIEVTATPERATYEPRETVAVDLAARPRRPPPGDPLDLQLAVAVLDEAVFDLVEGGSAAFDPYRGFYRLEPLDLSNYNLLTRLIGIQEFENKGADAGGGGLGDGGLRTLFDYVSYWNPALETDASGRARIEFQAPDNLTGWRVLVMAVSRGDRMGLGEGRFAVNQAIELRPALPNQVTEGDRFEARFTVMNRTHRERTLRIDAAVAGQGRSAGLDGLEVVAPPFERVPLSFPVEVLEDGEIRLTVRAGDGTEGDGLEVPIPVRRRQALEAAATYGTTTDDRVREEVLVPEGVRTDVGRISLVASPSVIGGVDGAFRYMRDYPYTCWEQKLTQAVMASHYAELRAYLPEDLEWPGHRELPQETLDLAAEYQAPGGGMAYFIPEDRYVSPYLSAYTSLAFGWLRQRGVTVPAGVEERLDAYLLRLLRRDVFPDFYSRGMASSVRAVALAALAEHGAVTRDELERYRRHLPEMDLFGKAHYLLAAIRLGAGPELVEEVEAAILAHADRSGGTIAFTESLDTGHERILHSGERTQCAILTALVEGGEAPAGTGVADLPFRLTRAITQARQRRDRWENTQANVFCLNALVDYSRVYESEPPRMEVEVSMDGERLGSTRFEDVRDAPAEIERPLGPGDPGRETSLEIERRGSGRLYYAARLFYSPRVLRTESVDAGLEVRREYSVERDGRWVLLEDPMEVQRGELVRVDLFLSLPAPRSFVVVDDPVPGGLEPVDRSLATASEVDAAEGDFLRSHASYWYTVDDWVGFGASRWSFYHRELRHHAARFYSDYLPAGNYHLSYTAQAVAAGEFQVLPLHAEELYDPD
ncbi:MAG: alpha-2-macroglobulin family protein, partial [Acidobacteriota bacterium]